MQNHRNTKRKPSAQGAEIADKTLLLKYHQAFYKLFHLPLDWMPPDNRTFTVCGKAHCNALCARIMESKEGALHCQQMEIKRSEEGRRTGAPIIDQCHAGFYDVTIPIFTDNLYLGSLCCGQYLLKMPSAREIRRREKQLAFLNLKPGELARYYRRTRILTKDESEGMIELMQLIASYIGETYGRWQFLESLHQSDPITQATQFIQRHYATSLTVDGLARSVGMSKSHFIHRFSEQTGHSPVVYINRFRIAQCIEMLRDSTLTVSQIAYLCGFSSITLFNRLFRRYTGKTPIQLRRENAEPKTESRP